MPERTPDRLLIQRIPRALQNILSLQGADTPHFLSDEVVGTIELLQLYGLNQLQTAAVNNAALGESGTLAITPAAFVGATNAWFMLYAVYANFGKTGTQTALRGEVYLNRTAGASLLLFSESLGPFGATETGTAGVGGFLPTPLLCPPQSQVFLTPTVIGTDANVNASLVCEFGLLG